MGSHYAGSPKETRALNAYIKLLRSTQSVTRRISAHRAVTDISSSQFGALEALYHLGPLPQKTIGEKLLVSKSNVVAIVDSLERCAFVKRRQDLDDRRIVNVSITEEGCAYIERTLPLHVHAIAQEFGCLTAPEQDELARLCRKLGLGEGA